jgi:hypothetical protein
MRFTITMLAALASKSFIGFHNFPDYSLFTIIWFYFILFYFSFNGFFWALIIFLCLQSKPNFSDYVYVNILALNCV